MSDLYTGYAITSAASILSIVSCVFIIILILKTERLRSRRENIHVVILLTFYTLLCFSSLIPTYTESKTSSPMCATQGILIQTFSLSGIIWTGYIALFRLMDIKFGRELKNYAIPLVSIVLFAFFTAIFPYALHKDEYGKGTCWCWYSKTLKEGSETRVKIYTFLFFYGIAWSVIFWILFVFTYLSCYLRNKNVETKRFDFYMYFPVILFICFIPLTISRISQSADDKVNTNDSKDFKGYFIFSAVVMRLLGFFNALAYGFNPQIKIEYFDTKSKSVENEEFKRTE